MKVMIELILLAFCATSCAAGDGAADRAIVYGGASDASAAVALNDELIVVADDENNVLRVYKTGGGSPVYSYDVSQFLGVEQEHPEADIEGATAVGDRIYWISSHGRNKDGKLRPSRYRFFATDVKVEDGKVTIKPAGRPCVTLVQTMVRAATMRRLGLEESTRLGAVNLSKKELDRLAPKEEGFNIEGLCAATGGTRMYIGIRNPRPFDKVTRRAKAIIACLENAPGVIDKGDVPVFAEPMLWDLDGMGVRSMEYSELHKVYFVVAGSADESPKFALYRWSGAAGDQPVLVRDLGRSNFSPEAVVPFGSSTRLLLLSDDGTVDVKVLSPTECMQGELNRDGTCPNKSLTDPERRTFRGVWLEP